MGLPGFSASLGSGPSTSGAQSGLTVIGSSGLGGGKDGWVFWVVVGVSVIFIVALLLRRKGK